jgi:dTMP kinase
VAGARFITLEGLDGAGKTTQVPALQMLIEGAGVALRVTREPGGTPLGERVRDLLLDPALAISPGAELALVFAARAEHVERVIAPALAAGSWVLCDRYVDASYAYQGGGRALGAAAVAAVERAFAPPVPNLTLLLDVPLEVARSRAAARGGADRFGREGAAFFERVRAAYLERARDAPERVCVVDASAAPGDVAAAVAAHVRPLLP